MNGRSTRRDDERFKNLTLPRPKLLLCELGGRTVFDANEDGVVEEEPGLGKPWSKEGMDSRRNHDDERR